MTHLKWTVFPNWEMKSDDAIGDDNQEQVKEESWGEREKDRWERN